MVDPSTFDRFASPGQKLDALTDHIHARFDEVISAIVEHRQYTEFASERFRSEMLAGFVAMTTNFERLERKLDLLIDRLIEKHRDTD